MSTTVITSLAIKTSDKQFDVLYRGGLYTCYPTTYVSSGMKLIADTLKYTPYDIIMVTNVPEYFNDVADLSRVTIIDYDQISSEPISSGSIPSQARQLFNMHLKRFPIKEAMKRGYDIIFYNDCDCFMTGWDEESFDNKCAEDFDVCFMSSVDSLLGDLRRDYPRFQKIIDIEFGDLYHDGFDRAPNPSETRVIFKNNEKLSKFLEFWDAISARNKDYNTYHDGIYFGTSAVHADMNLGSMFGERHKFTDFCKIAHRGFTLNCFGVREDLV